MFACCCTNTNLGFWFPFYFSEMKNLPLTLEHCIFWEKRPVAAVHKQTGRGGAAGIKDAVNEFSYTFFEQTQISQRECKNRI